MPDCLKLIQSNFFKRHFCPISLSSFFFFYSLFNRFSDVGLPIFLQIFSMVGCARPILLMATSISQQETKIYKFIYKLQDTQTSTELDFFSLSTIITLVLLRFTFLIRQKTFTFCSVQQLGKFISLFANRVVSPKPRFCCFFSSVDTPPCQLFKVC